MGQEDSCVVTKLQQLEERLIVIEDLYQQQVPAAVKQEPKKEPAAAETIITIPKKPADHLFSIKQMKNESMKQFVERFKEEADQVQGFSDDIAIKAMTLGLLANAGPDNFANTDLFNSLSAYPAESYADLLQRVSKLAEYERRINRNNYAAILISLVFITIGIAWCLKGAWQLMDKVLRATHN